MDQDVSEEALINDQQLFRQRQAYEQQEAVARQAEAEERSAAIRSTTPRYIAGESKFRHLANPPKDSAHKHQC